MNRLNIKYLRILIAIFLSIFLFVEGYLFGMYHMRIITDNRVLHHLSNRLDIEENWGSLADYVYCDVFVFGRSLDEIESDLSEVDFFNATYYDDDDFWAIYFFSSGPIRRELQRPVLWFDKNKILIRKEIWGKSLDGYLPLECQ